MKTSYEPVHQPQGYQRRMVFHFAPAGAQMKGYLHQNFLMRLRFHWSGLLLSHTSQTEMLEVETKDACITKNPTNNCSFNSTFPFNALIQVQST